MRKLLDRLFKSQEIGGPNYMHRWFLLVLGPLVEVYLHRFAGSDKNRCAHDHPWLFNMTIVLRGSYIEETETSFEKRSAGRLYVRFGKARHIIPETEPGTITLFIGFIRWREWGFYPHDDGRFVDHHSYKRGLIK